MCFLQVVLLFQILIRISNYYFIYYFSTFFACPKKVEQKKDTAFNIPAEGGIICSSSKHSFEQLFNNTNRSQADASHVP